MIITHVDKSDATWSSNQRAMTNCATVDELSRPAAAYANALVNGLSETEALAVAQEQLCQQTKAANIAIACPRCEGRHRPHTCGQGNSQLQAADASLMPKKRPCVMVAVPQMTPRGRGRVPPPPPPPPPPLPPSSQLPRPIHSTAPPLLQPCISHSPGLQYSPTALPTPTEAAYENMPSLPCGSSICEHGRRRSECKECGGSGICEHGRRRSQCKECGGSGICEHGRVRSQCKECGGGGICEHGRLRSRCKECGGGSFCEHGRRRSTCKECGGGSFCEHGRVRSQCKECGGSLGRCAGCDHCAPPAPSPLTNVRSNLVAQAHPTAEGAEEESTTLLVAAPVSFPTRIVGLLPR